MKKFFILFLGLFIAAFLVKMVASQALAYGGSGNYLPLAQRITERFNLDSNEVQSFFNEMRQEKIQRAQGRAEIKLNEALSSGKITQAQKEAIAEKMNELNQKMEGLNNLPLEERRVKMQELQKEIKEWAGKNGINFGFLRRFQVGFGRRLGPKGSCPNL